MVLLHGLQDCARSWDFFGVRMQPQYHVLALDHRGRGDSPWAPNASYRFQDYVDELDGFIDNLRLDKIILMGHSAGGREAMLYAAHHQERVELLIIVDIGPDAVSSESLCISDRYLSESDEDYSLNAVIENLRSREPDASDEILRHHALHLTHELPGGRHRWKRDRTVLEAYERPDLWQELSQIERPTLVVRGRDSSILTHETAVKMKEALARCRLAELEGGGHWVYDEVPGSFEAAVRWFLQNPPQ